MLMHAIAHGVMGGGGVTDTLKRVCSESWFWEKNPLPHRGIEPTSAACRSNTLATELYPHPSSLCTYIRSSTAISARGEERRSAQRLPVLGPQPYRVGYRVKHHAASLRVRKTSDPSSSSCAKETALCDHSPIESATAWNMRPTSR